DRRAALVRSAKRTLVFGYVDLGGFDGSSPDVGVGIRRVAACLREERAVRLLDRRIRRRDGAIGVLNEVGAGSKSKVTRRLIAVAGGEAVDAHARNDMNLRDRMNIILRVKRY